MPRVFFQTPLGAHSAPPDPQLHFQSPTFKKEGQEKKGKEKRDKAGRKEEVRDERKK